MALASFLWVPTATRFYTKPIGGYYFEGLEICDLVRNYSDTGREKRVFFFLIAYLPFSCLFLGLSKVTISDIFEKLWFFWRVLKQRQVMADWHGIMSKNTVGCSRRSMRDEDFETEDQVWSYEKKKEDSSPTPRNARESSSSSSSAWRLPSATRIMRRVSNSASHETKVAQQSSAPMNIPDWSKIYGKHSYMEYSSRNRSWVDNGDHGMVYDDGDYGGRGEDEDDDMVPPHEWLARKLSRSQISSFSVCEGMGRTLKGRDLSKVRNAVLTKTGFLE